MKFLQPPVPKKNWEGTLDATKDGNICVQSSDPVVGSEDCLFVNVYVPKVVLLINNHLSFKCRKESYYDTGWEN